MVERIGEFDADNRAGLERTLHRISAIRNRRGYIVGLTCRVGRAVYGTTDIIKDLIESGKSLLILGRPGVGKTTMLREAARILAETKRVVIVDTSNEIGGDGDVPHPAVGRARRMQVATPSLQHEVMIEAVENHNPEAIVIDEIGRELEAAAARTIAERGVQLIGTAHGNTLENLLLNPTLSDLVGGIESVTLSDEEARRRGTQKTVLERRSPPTFDVLIEIQNARPRGGASGCGRGGRRLAARLPAAARDSLARWMGISASSSAPAPARPQGSGQQGYRRQNDEYARPRGRSGLLQFARSDPRRSRCDGFPLGCACPPQSATALQSMRIYPYGVARNRLSQAARRLGVPGGHRGRAGRGRCAGDPALLLPQAQADHHGGRTAQRPDLRAALQHRQPDAAVPGRSVQPVRRRSEQRRDGFGRGRNPPGHPRRDEWRALGGAAPGGFVHPPHAAPDGARSQPGLAFLWQRAEPARAHLPRDLISVGNKGIFITFEGPEGSGKTSQLAALADSLRQAGYPVLTTREPGGTPIGDQVRSVLMGLKNTEMQPRTEILLFQASRAQLVEQVILPHLADGYVVLCDRYANSTLAYQGYGYQKFTLEQLRPLIAFATGGLAPDLTLLLDVEVNVGLQRRMQDGD